ncbi:MAG TPA: DJ-1/PfpI family protein [Pyrinomonadaceae bacterium]|jgi:transcriptional regulator GlxA family with amidase domain|nr:DJ-1/PfpI family protein [Pyrinomonadaceae bacterium]
MRRREFLVTGATATLMTSTNIVPIARTSVFAEPKPAEANKLTPPADGAIPVAFAISRGATMIDFAGPWEVFQDVMIPAKAQDGQQGHANHRMAFNLYTVSEKVEPIEASAGMKIIPDYTFETAPAPKVVVIPAQAGSPALHAWLRKIVDSTDVTMSVCTGAFQLGKAGLLAGKEATTHHEFFDQFAKAFPDVKLKRGLRFVENAKISTAGGLTSGIDLALRVVERYFGRETAEQTAFYMEYQSKGWIV